MAETAQLTDQLLIAMPTLEDPNFARTVSYVCQHNEHGAMGIVINRPLEIRLSDVLVHMEIDVSGDACKDIPVFLGGPVQPERGFVLHHPGDSWESTLCVSEHIAVTTSRDILQAIARREGPKNVLVALGYAGWGAGQLEKEILQNAWLFGPSSLDILFRTDVEQRWSAAAAKLGVDLALLSSEAGHG